jgi:hypothetical protein
MPAISARKLFGKKMAAGVAALGNEAAKPVQGRGQGAPAKLAVVSHIWSNVDATGHQIDPEKSRQESEANGLKSVRISTHIRSELGEVPQ